MAFDLGGVLVGWLVSLFGDRWAESVQDERKLHQAMELAIERVVSQANSSSRYLLRQGLRKIFSTPPQLALDAFTSVSEGLRAAVISQVTQLDNMMHGDTGKLFYQVVRVDRAWLVEQVHAAFLIALRQVVATSGPAELVRGLDAADLLEALKRVRIDTTPDLVRVRVRDTQPRLLGVHRAIHVEGAQEYLPSYVPRDLDIAERGVRALVGAAAERGGFVLLVGTSSVGKTRCVYEAITALLPDWQLVHPIAGSEQLARLAADPVAQTVVWLDDLQRYLDGRDRLTADIVRLLLNASGPIVLVATLWPGYHSIYTTPPQDFGGDDRYRWEREVIALAEIIHLDADWSATELQRAREIAAGDPRIKYAVSQSGRFSVPQILAAAPQLVDRWNDADPYAAAVLVAAVDATRLGYRCPLPADLLRAAAEGYCESRARENPPADWFESALDYATKSLHGAVSALRPVTAGMGIIVGYTVADYLLQYATPKRHRQLIPRHTWDALLTHTHDPADAGRIGRAASNRLLYSYALPLLRRGAAAGNSQDVDRLADLLIGQDDIDAAALLLRGHADGEPVAAERLAGLLAERGDVKALGERADAGDSFAAFQLADLLAEAGDIKALGERADAGDSFAAFQLADLLAEQGDFDAAIGLLRKHDAVMTLSFEARWWLVRVMELCFGVLMMHGYDLDPIVSSLQEHDVQSRIGAQIAELFDMPGTMHKRADNSRPFGASAKIDELLAKRGDVNALRERIHAGDFFAVDQLAGLLVKRGDTDAAITLLSEHADAGDPFAAMGLARLLKEQGNTDTLRERANAGDPFAIGALAGLLIKQGDADAAITLLREHADSGHFLISVKLRMLLAEQNDTDVLRERAAGDPIAIVELTERGETEAAIALLRGRADAGILFADMRLAHLLAKQSDAEKLLLTEVQVGNSEHAADAWFRLLENSDNPQDQDRARRTRRFGLIPPVP